MDFGGGRGGYRACRREPIPGTTDHPRRLDHSCRGIEILDDAQAGGVSRSRQDLQYRMDAIPGHRADDAGAGRRRAGLRDPGAAVAGEWRGRRQSEGLHRGPARVRKARRLLGLLGGQGRLADQDHRGSQGQDHRHFGDRRRHPGAVQHAAEEERRSTRPRTSSWSKSGSRFPRTRCARAASMPST